MPHFGKKVVGAKAYAEAVRNEVGGANVFGRRVRGAIPADSATNIAKRNTEHGPRVTVGASASDETGKAADGVSIESLRNILAENPTTFDSLYEVELAREDGARPDALEIFYEVERGIKGAGRRDILDEIKALLDEKQPLSERQAADGELRMQQLERMKARQEENKKLVDAKAIRATVQREEDLDALKKRGVEITSPFVDTQLNDLSGGKRNQPEEGHHPTVPAKPDGPVHPETQQPGNRLGVPKETTGKSKRRSSKKRS